MEVDDPTAKPPSKILAFDSAKEREAAPVDLDSPFFAIARTDYSKCDHRDRGVTLDTATRKTYCLCGELIDNFDALLIYAHAQQRLVNQANTIKAHYQKEADKKAAKPFVVEVSGVAARYLTRKGKPTGRIIGYELSLRCGHRQYWDRRRPPRRVTCAMCVRNAKLKAEGVGVVTPVNRLTL